MASKFTKSKEAAQQSLIEMNIKIRLFAYDQIKYFIRSNDYKAAGYKSLEDAVCKIVQKAEKEIEQNISAYECEYPTEADWEF